MKIQYISLIFYFSDEDETDLTFYYLHDVIDMTVRAQNSFLTEEYFDQLECPFGLNHETSDELTDELNEYRCSSMLHIEKYKKDPTAKNIEEIRNCNQVAYRIAQMCYWKSENYYQQITGNKILKKHQDKLIKRWLDLYEMITDPAHEYVNLKYLRNDIKEDAVLRKIMIYLMWMSRRDKEKFQQLAEYFEQWNLSERISLMQKSAKEFDVSTNTVLQFTEKYVDKIEPENKTNLKKYKNSMLINRAFQKILC